MLLTTLIESLQTLHIAGSTDLDITGVCTDSRLVKPGNLFVAVKGTQTDMPISEKPLNSEPALCCTANPWQRCRKA